MLPTPEHHASVRFVGVRKAFAGVPVLDGVSFTVSPGETALVMGGSGSGKSVLIKHVVGLLKPDEGEVWVRDTRVDVLGGNDLDRVRLRTGYLFQGGALFDSMTVTGNIEFLLERHTALDASARKGRIDELLDWVRLQPALAARYPAELSGGQKKRVALARALALEPELMLFDEPTTGLDPVSVRAVSELIVRLREERGMTSLVITHDLLCAEITGGTVHFLNEGRIVSSGTLVDVSRSNHPFVRNFFGA